MRRGLIVCALFLLGCNPVREISLPFAAPSRVICASPAIAEIVFALGQGERVVGVSDFTDWPPEVAQLPTIGGALSPNRERILALQPDLILAQGQAEVLRAFAKTIKVEFRTFPLETLSDIENAISEIAKALEVPERGRELLAQWRAEMAAIPVREPVTVFIALGHTPGDLSGLMTTGAGTFLAELVERAGGKNTFDDVAILWPKVSIESLIRRTPTLILDIQSAPTDAARRTALTDDWQKRGFRPEQIRILDEDYLLKPGPRSPQAATRIATAIHGNP